MIKLLFIRPLLFQSNGSMNSSLKGLIKNLSVYSATIFSFFRQWGLCFKDNLELSVIGLAHSIIADFIKYYKVKRILKIILL